VRSVNRSPVSDVSPCDGLRWMTGPRSARSGGVRWCHAGNCDERPERGPELQEVVREPAVQAVAFAAVAGILEQFAEFVLDRLHLTRQAAAVLVLGERVPDGEQPSGERQARYAGHATSVERTGGTAGLCRILDPESETPFALHQIAAVEDPY
jgi:hypothetical protein